ncbi:Pherophorin-dz1 protein [Rhodotorula toruloides ATCC 204091]|uniref:BY PROTMAP: gi/342320449/gb/EGU12389.1/ Pherophorin-dz1 protein [Rhodotorula glutinis ATCC 204091] n=1 Tax=Rhodotorula toruloides TaxID=5286 RepID=A0A0K3CHV9_RHOTO|nr:Pherophorin-dz1 protein [Rhodotorula toruloides ATCC 204091]KAK4332787.1 Pherophorin-dz1 protein [Rhodotorula toruloides]PRQ73892.1 hypothetical protein AAT19DRAFT_15459 [Rhodotorula toruloides]
MQGPPPPSGTPPISRSPSPVTEDPGYIQAQVAGRPYVSAASLRETQLAREAAEAAAAEEAQAEMERQRIAAVQQAGVRIERGTLGRGAGLTAAELDKTQENPYKERVVQPVEDSPATYKGTRDELHISVTELEAAQDALITKQAKELIAKRFDRDERKRPRRVNVPAPPWPCSDLVENDYGDVLHLATETSRAASTSTDAPSQRRPIRIAVIARDSRIPTTWVGAFGQVLAALFIWALVQIGRGFGRFVLGLPPHAFQVCAFVQIAQAATPMGQWIVRYSNFIPLPNQGVNYRALYPTFHHHIVLGAIGNGFTLAGIFLPGGGGGGGAPPPGGGAGGPPGGGAAGGGGGGAGGPPGGGPPGGGPQGGPPGGGAPPSGGGAGGLGGGGLGGGAGGGTGGAGGGAGGGTGGGAGGAGAPPGAAGGSSAPSSSSASPKTATSSPSSASTSASSHVQQHRTAPSITTTTRGNRVKAVGTKVREKAPAYSGLTRDRYASGDPPAKESAMWHYLVEDEEALEKYKSEKNKGKNVERPAAVCFSFNKAERDEAVAAWDRGWTPKSSTPSAAATAVLHKLEAERAPRQTASHEFRDALKRVQERIGKQQVTKGGRNVGVVGGARVAGPSIVIRDPSGRNVLKDARRRREYPPGTRLMPSKSSYSVSKSGEQLYEEVYTCIATCGFEGSKGDLRQHLKGSGDRKAKEAKTKRDSKMRCPAFEELADNVFAGELSLLERQAYNLSLHPSAFPCPSCPRIFKTTTTLGIHEKRHRDGKLTASGCPIQRRDKSKWIGTDDPLPYPMPPAWFDACSKREEERAAGGWEYPADNPPLFRSDELDASFARPSRSLGKRRAVQEESDEEEGEIFESESSEEEEEPEPDEEDELEEEGDFASDEENEFGRQEQQDWVAENEEDEDWGEELGGVEEESHE